MLVGYARVSSSEQETSLQLDALKRAGVRRVLQEKRSAVGRRPVLDYMLSMLKRGDTVVVYKVDRLARSLRDLLQLLERFRSLGVGFRSLTEPFDTSSSVGELVLHILGAVAQFERSMIRERSIAGQLAARERGVVVGRRRSMTPQQQNACYRKWSTGRYSMAELAGLYGVHVSSIKRVILRVENPDSPAVATRSVPVLV